MLLARKTDVLTDLPMLYIQVLPHAPVDGDSSQMVSKHHKADGQGRQHSHVSSALSARGVSRRKNDYHLLHVQSSKSVAHFILACSEPLRAILARVSGLSGHSRTSDWFSHLCDVGHRLSKFHAARPDRLGK